MLGDMKMNIDKLNRWVDNNILYFVLIAVVLFIYIAVNWLLIIFGVW